MVQVDRAREARYFFIVHQTMKTKMASAAAISTRKIQKPCMRGYTWAWWMQRVFANEARRAAR
jgi:hypothetical protein